MADFVEIIDRDEEFQLTIGGSTFDLRRLDPDEYERIEKLHTTWKRNRAAGGMRYPVVDNLEVNKDLLDYCIKGWHDVINPVTKAEVECTRATKWKLPGTVKVQINEACDVEAVTKEKKKDESGSGDISSTE